MTDFEHHATSNVGHLPKGGQTRTRHFPDNKEWNYLFCSLIFRILHVMRWMEYVLYVTVNQHTLLLQLWLIADDCGLMDAETDKSRSADHLPSGTTRIHHNSDVRNGF